MGVIKRDGVTVIDLVWKKIKTGSLVSLGGASATSGKYIRFASVSFTGTFAEASGVFLVYDNNHLNYDRHTCVLTLSCLTGSTTGPVANSVKIDAANIDENILNEFYVSFNPTYSGTANTFDFYFKQTSTYSSIVVEFLSSSTRNNTTQMNPVQNYFDLELEYDSNGNLVTHDTIPSNGEVATFLSKMSTLPVYFPVSPLVPTTPSGASAAVAKSYADLKVALAGNETITGIKTFTTGATPLITDEPTNDLHAVNKEHLDGIISDLQTTINDLLTRIAVLESSGSKVYFTKNTYAVSITATQDGSSVSTGFTGVSSKVIVITLTEPANGPVYGYYFSGWTKDGVTITSGSDGFTISNNEVAHTSTLTFTYGSGKGGTYQGNVTKYTLPPLT
jgi:hypothetical protein